MNVFEWGAIKLTVIGILIIIFIALFANGLSLLYGQDHNAYNKHIAISLTIIGAIGMAGGLFAASYYIRKLSAMPDLTEVEL